MATTAIPAGKAVMATRLPMAQRQAVTILGLRVALARVRLRHSDQHHPPHTGPQAHLAVGWVGAMTRAVPVAPATPGILRPQADRHRVPQVDHRDRRISLTGQLLTRRA